MTRSETKFKVIDNLIGSVRAKLPEGYSFNFFITQVDSLGIRGVWYLQSSQVPKAQKKQPASEVKIKTRRIKKG